MRILLVDSAYERLEARLAPLAGRVECLIMDERGMVSDAGRTVSPEEAQPESAFLSFDALFSELAGPFLDVLLRSEALEWVQSAGAGVDHATFVKLAQKGVRICTSHGQSVAIADYTLWGVLNHFQNGRLRAADQAARRWSRSTAREIEGTRWLVVGFGAIGKGVARRAKAFGAHVTGVRRTAEPSPLADEMITPERLREHVGTADVIVFAVPQTPETVNLADASFFAAMKPGSVLVNVGRGSALDEEALLAALDRGTPEHAVLDVFRTEPLPPESRFWDHPRVTLTPHLSGGGISVRERLDDLLLENIRRYLAGDDLRNEIDPREVLAGALPAVR